MSWLYWLFFLKNAISRRRLLDDFLISKLQLILTHVPTNSLSSYRSWSYKLELSYISAHVLQSRSSIFLLHLYGDNGWWKSLGVSTLHLNRPRYWWMLSLSMFPCDKIWEFPSENNPNLQMYGYSEHTSIYCISSSVISTISWYNLVRFVLPPNKAYLGQVGIFHIDLHLEFFVVIVRLYIFLIIR